MSLTSVTSLVGKARKVVAAARKAVIALAAVATALGLSGVAAPLVAAGSVLAGVLVWFTPNSDS